MGTESKPSFWSTAPGILTGVAAVLTAATGAYVALHRPGSIPQRPDSLPPPNTSPAPSASEPPYLRIGSYPHPDLAEFTLAPPPPELTDSTGFLRLSDASYGTVGSTPGAGPDVFRFELILTNTTAAPLALDLSSRYFSLEDDRGRSATMLYFCCPAQGTVLAPRQSRTLVLYFRSREWYGKSVQAHLLSFRVTGLLPIERATWHVLPLATAA
jgi:hypothetical protein